jgi:hypothetical protein
MRTKENAKKVTTKHQQGQLKEPKEHEQTPKRGLPKRKKQKQQLPKTATRPPKGPRTKQSTTKTTLIANHRLQRFKTAEDL